MKGLENPGVSSGGMCPHGNDPEKCATCQEARVVESDHRFDIVEGGMGARRLEKLGLQERLKTPEERKKLFAGLTDEQYQKMLGYVNSLVRGKKISYGYGHSAPPMLAVPPREMKDPLMRETFAAVREILADESATPEVALRLAGLTMGGAVNYIHPYDDGNGRVGRLMHYLMEFGTEREGVTDDELRALIAKAPLYEGELDLVIEDTPPVELELALKKTAAAHDAGYADLDEERQAAEAVRAYLKMMKGEISVPLTRDARIVTRRHAGETPKVQEFPKGSIDGRAYYLRSYESGSTAPNRSHDQMPPGASLTKLRRDERDDF